VKSKLYRAAAGLVGFGCVLVLLHMIMNWKGFSLGVVFAIINLTLGAWFLLDYALRRPARVSVADHAPSQSS
jgi:Flp pilus assembly protein TadB